MTAQLAYPVQAQPFTLSGSGSSIADTVLNLKSFKSILGVNLAMASFGTVGYGTIEPGNGNQEEQISFSGVTQNSDGTAQLTGVKHVLFISPFTESSGMTITHPGSTTFVISNTSAFENSLYVLLQTTVASGGLPASSTQIGITKLSIDPSSLANPIAVGDNDTRIPTVNASSITAGQLAALFGTVGTASSINKYVTNNDTSITPASGTVLRALGTGLVSASYIPVGVASGQIIQANATGLPVIDGSNLTAVLHGFGSWTSAGSDGNGYQVNSDGFVTAYGTNGTGIGTIVIKTDSASTPTTIRVQSGDSVNNVLVGATCPVRKNDYYSITATGVMGTITAYFISLR